MSKENKKETPEMWNAEEKRLERKARLNSLKHSDGQKKEIRGSGIFTRVITPIIVVVLVLAIGIWAAVQFAVPQKLFPPMSIGGEKITSAEFSYIYYTVLGQLGIDKTTDEGKEKLSSMCTEEGYTDVTWREYAYELTAEQVTESHILYDLALKDDMELSEDELAEVDKIFDDLVNQLGSKVETDKYLMEQFGKDVTLNSLRPVFEKLTLVDKYAQTKVEAMTIDASEIEEVYNENPDDYDKVTFRLAYFPIETDEEADEAEKEQVKEDVLSKAQAFLDEVTDGESFKQLTAEKEEEYEKEQYEKLTTEEKVEADAKKEEEEKAEEDLLATMSEEEKAEYLASEENSDTSIMHMMSKADLSGANQEMADWLFEEERKAGDKEVFDFTSGYYAIYFVSRDTQYELPSVRHILISPNEEKDASAGDVFTKEEWDSARELANEVLDKCTDKESFIELVGEYSADPGSSSSEGLYEDVAQGQMMPTFNDWTFDPDREEGDTGIVRTSYGFHVMWFEGNNSHTSLSQNTEAIEAGLKQEKFQADLDAKKELDEYEYTIHSFGVKLTDLG